MFQEFVHKAGNEKNVNQGLKIYGSDEAFQNFRKQLEISFKVGRKEFPKIVEKITPQAVTSFFQISKDIFDSYSRMDPFFTDRAYQQSESNSIIEKNLKVVQKIKDSYRADINTFFLEKNNYLETFLKNISKKFSIPTNHLSWYLINDLNALFQSVTLTAQQISARKLAYVQIGYGETSENYFGNDALNVMRDIKKVPVTENQIHGVVAHCPKQARIQGVVKIVSVDYGNMDAMRIKMEEMEQGQILVAQTTAPELMEACRKAGAIVTDVGGLLSHAAIVSREMDIPCIVGTHYATKILKDGDKVEIDANVGIVKILKKHD